MKARGVWCKRCAKLHWSGEWPRECVEERLDTSKRGAVARPYVRTDGMDTIINHADGLLYDSRSAYEKAVKAAGCVILGNDLPEPSAPPEITEADIKSDIKTAIDQLEARL